MEGWVANTLEYKCRFQKSLRNNHQNDRFLKDSMGNICELDMFNRKNILPLYHYKYKLAAFYGTLSICKLHTHTFCWLIGTSICQRKSKRALCSSFFTDIK